MTSPPTVPTGPLVFPVINLSQLRMFADEIQEQTEEAMRARARACWSVGDFWESAVDSSSDSHWGFW